MGYMQDSLAEGRKQDFLRNKLKEAILKELSDDYLHSIGEIADALGDRRGNVQDALAELQRENKVGTIRRRWCRRKP